MADDVIKVLIVDDIPETREMLKRLLAFENDINVVDAAQTGREGLELAAEHKPDIILMDINMPDMDGITATEQLRKLLPAAGVIMMSVQTESDYLRRAMMAGARDFLNKPISGENLYETIRRVYDLLEQERAQFSQLSEAASQAGSGLGSLKKKTSGNVIAVYSPQGGAGTTTIATNMAVGLMREGTKVIVVDADLQFGDVGVFLNLNNKYTLVDLTTSEEVDEDLVNNIAVAHGSGLKVLLGPNSPDMAEKIISKDLVSTVEQMTEYYDYIIVDMGKRLDDLALGIMDLAERIVLIATPTLPSIKNTRLMLDLFQALEYDDEKIMFVMNRVTDAKGRSAIPIDAIENNLRRKTNARIPLNDTVFLAAVNQGVSVIATDTTKSPARDLLQLAESVRRSVEGVEEPDLSEAQQPERKSSRLSGIFGRG